MSMPANMVDTTGAGDVFATAFILALANAPAGGNVAMGIVEAGRLASAFAAAKVERVGPVVLPARAALTPVPSPRGRRDSEPAHGDAHQ